MPLSCPAATGSPRGARRGSRNDRARGGRFRARAQDMSQAADGLVLQLEAMMSCLAWNMTHETLFTCPLPYPPTPWCHSCPSFTWRSSAPETMSGSDGWNDASSPWSCPASGGSRRPPNRSVFALCAPRMEMPSSPPGRWIRANRRCPTARSGRATPTPPSPPWDGTSPT